MKAHKYRIGQTVRFKPPMPSSGFLDVKIERLLPAELGVNQYQVYSQSDGHKRVVRESEIGH